jgi:hypothetical protein
MSADNERGNVGSAAHLPPSPFFTQLRRDSLVARRTFIDAPGCCLSCGDPHGPDRRFRCGPCVRAAEIVINEAWEASPRHRPDAPEEQHHDQ